jgi:hypothetical protein
VASLEAFFLRDERRQERNAAASINDADLLQFLSGKTIRKHDIKSYRNRKEYFSYQHNRLPNWVREELECGLTLLYSRVRKGYTNVKISLST